MVHHTPPCSPYSGHSGLSLSPLGRQLPDPAAHSSNPLPPLPLASSVCRPISVPPLVRGCVGLLTAAPA